LPKGSARPPLRAWPTSGPAVAGRAGGPGETTANPPLHDRRALEPRWVAGACPAAAFSALGRIRRRWQAQAVLSAVRCPVHACRAPPRPEPTLAQLKASSPAGLAPSSATEARSQEPDVAPALGQSPQPAQAWRQGYDLLVVPWGQSQESAAALPWGLTRKSAAALPWGQSQESAAALPWGLTRKSAVTPLDPTQESWVAAASGRSQNLQPAEALASTREPEAGMPNRLARARGYAPTKHQSAQPAYGMTPWLATASPH
jgi:hypothetical protein